MDNKLFNALDIDKDLDAFHFGLLKEFVRIH